MQLGMFGRQGSCVGGLGSGAKSKQGERLPEIEHATVLLCSVCFGEEQSTGNLSSRLIWEDGHVSCATRAPHNAIPAHIGSSISAYAMSLHQGPQMHHRVHRFRLTP